MVKVNSGDFVKMEFTGRDSAGNLFDTTSAEEARKSGAFDAKGKYGPVLVIVGKNVLLKGLDEAVLGSEEGVAKDIVIPKEKAFGERKPEMVRLIPISKFRDQGIDPVAGMPLELDGMRARVQSVSGGRVRVDFNHELAGQELKYSFKIVKVYSKPEEKLVALGEDALGVKEVSLANGVASVKIGTAAAKGQEFLAGKLRFLDFALRFVDGVKEVVFEEHYALQKEKA